jgi:hypothetical protein
LIEGRNRLHLLLSYDPFSLHHDLHSVCTYSVCTPSAVVVRSTTLPRSHCNTYPIHTIQIHSLGHEERQGEEGEEGGGEALLIPVAKRGSVVARAEEAGRVVVETRVDGVTCSGMCGGPMVSSR